MYIGVIHKGRHGTKDVLTTELEPHYLEVRQYLVTSFVADS
jgi:hypothetical protein